jgi:hypothetical protein
MKVKVNVLYCTILWLQLVATVRTVATIQYCVQHCNVSFLDRLSQFMAAVHSTQKLYSTSVRTGSLNKVFFGSQVLQEKWVGRPREP